MNIYILTYKRDRIVTPKYIPERWTHHTTLVVQEGDDALAGPSGRWGGNWPAPPTWARLSRLDVRHCRRP